MSDFEYPLSIESHMDRGEMALHRADVEDRAPEFRKMDALLATAHFAAASAKMSFAAGKPVEYEVVSHEPFEALPTDVAETIKRMAAEDV